MSFRSCNHSLWLPPNLQPRTTPCFGCHSNSVVDLGGVWRFWGCIARLNMSVCTSRNESFCLSLFVFCFKKQLPPPCAPLDFPSSFLLLLFPVPLPMSLEIVSTDNQLVPPPLPSPPSSSSCSTTTTSSSRHPFGLLTGSRRQPCPDLDE